MSLESLSLSNNHTHNSDIPIIYIKTALLDEEFEGRSPALILTKEDIYNIKRYEQHSLNLPVTLAGVEQALGFKKAMYRVWNPTTSCRPTARFAPTP